MVTEVIQPPPQRRIIGPQTNIYLHELTDVAPSAATPTAGDVLTFTGGSWQPAAAATGGGGATGPDVIRLSWSPIPVNGAGQLEWGLTSTNFPGQPGNARYDENLDKIIAKAGTYVVTVQVHAECSSAAGADWPTVETVLGTYISSQFRTEVLSSDQMQRFRHPSTLTQPEVASNAANIIDWVDVYVVSASSSDELDPSTFVVSFFAAPLKTAGTSYTMNVKLTILMERIGDPKPMY